ncbi:reverse transcriptase (RNA-dependent DNA polymerase) domain-containing protein [Phthorimaea operculella]|nr:reverse transcriptase (RNA-dependent DNA polymerase) domain-containing protein [Phthorimaea operculella]
MAAHLQPHQIPSQVGAQQGDPLGPLIFSLAIHKVIKSLKSSLNVWYLDDGTIGGTTESVAQDVKTLITELSHLGLQVNPSKCEIFSCGEEANNNIAIFNSLLPGVRTLNENTLALLGAPIFPNAIPAALETKSRMIVQLATLDKWLSSLTDPSSLSLIIGLSV